MYVERTKVRLGERDGRQGDRHLSDVEILKAFGHALAGMRSGGEMQNSTGAQVTRHDQHAEPAVDESWYVFNGVQRSS